MGLRTIAVVVLAAALGWLVFRAAVTRRVPWISLGIVVLLLVMLGHDLGTAIVISAIVAGMLFAGGVRMKWFGIGGVLGMIALAGALRGQRQEHREGCVDPDQKSESVARAATICS